MYINMEKSSNMADNNLFFLEYICMQDFLLQSGILHCCIATSVKELYALCFNHSNQIWMLWSSDIQLQNTLFVFYFDKFHMYRFLQTEPYFSG